MDKQHYEHESYTDYNTSICLDEGTTTEGDLNSKDLKFCKLQVWGRYFLNSYLVLELAYVLASCSKKMKKMKKNERSCHGDNIESSSTNHHGKYSQCPAFDIKQSPAGRSPRITRYVLMPISLWIKLNHVSLLPLSVHACSSLNVFDASHIHRPFKSSMVFGLKCPPQSN